MCRALPKSYLGRKQTVTQITPSIWVTAAVLSDPSVLTQEIWIGNTDYSVTSAPAHLGLLFSELLQYSPLIHTLGSQSFTTGHCCLTISLIHLFHLFTSMKHLLWGEHYCRLTHMLYKFFILSLTLLNTSIFSKWQKRKIKKNERKSGFMLQWGNMESLFSGIKI